MTTIIKFYNLKKSKDSDLDNRKERANLNEKTDNSVYTVTYPDLHITDDGMSVLVTSTDNKFIDPSKRYI